MSAQGVPAGVGDWDEAMDHSKEVWMGISVGSIGNGEDWGCNK